MVQLHDAAGSGSVINGLEYRLMMADTADGYPYEVIVVVRHYPDVAVDTLRQALKQRLRMWLGIAQDVRAGVTDLSKEEWYRDIIPLPAAAGLLPRIQICSGAPITRQDGTNAGLLLITDQTAAKDALDFFNGALAPLGEVAAKAKPKTAPAPVQRGAQTPPQQTAPQQASGDVIDAPKPPSPNTPQYQDGQMVRYAVNKIEKSTNQGSPTWKLWGPLGAQYPLVTVYRYNKAGADTPVYKSIGTVLDALGLSVDEGRVFATGQWELICRAGHAGGKEYMNAVSLTSR